VAGRSPGHRKIPGGFTDQSVLIPGEADPYPRLARLRESGPIAYSAAEKVYLVLSYPAAVDFLRSAHVSRQAYVDELICRHGQNAILAAQKKELAFQDPPHHTVVKRLVMQVFTPAHLKAYRPRLEEIAKDSLERLPIDEPFDLLERWAEPIPSAVLAELIGVPAERREALYDATRNIVAARGLTRSSEQLARGNQAVAQLTELFDDLSGQRRRAPKSDLLTALLQAEDGGERLDHTSLISVASSLYAAGFGNTRNLIGNGLVALDSRPEVVEKVLARPELWHGLIEEILRFDSPTQATNPTVLAEPFTWQEDVLPAQSRVALHLGSCNRDAAHFQSPDEFLPERYPNDHLGFASGTHFCAGAALVRLQAEVLLRGLLERYVVRVEGSLEWQQMNRFRGLTRLPVRLRHRRA